MKFISKNSNLRIILRPGLPASPLTGAQAVPTIFVKFQNGVAEVGDEEQIKLMLKHPGFFGGDYICADEITRDPFANTRQEMEPVHKIAEIKYGTVEKSVVSPHRVKVSPEMEAIINQLAMEKVKEILESMVAPKVEEKKMNPEVLTPSRLTTAPEPVEEGEESIDLSDGETEDLTDPALRVKYEDVEESELEIKPKATRGRPKTKKD